MPRHKSVRSTPEGVEEAFYESLELGDLEALMKLWSEDEHVVCIHPGGVRAEGFNEVRDSWRMVFEAGSLQVRAVSSHRVTSGVISVHNVVEQVVISGGGGNSEVLQINSTNVYHNGPNGWKLIVHHSSQASQLQELGDIETLADGPDNIDEAPTLH